MANRSAPYAIVIALLLAGIGAAVFLLLPGSKDSEDSKAKKTDNAARPTAEAPAPERPGPRAPGDKPLPEARSGDRGHARKLTGKQARERLVRAIEQARKARLAKLGAPSEGGADKGAPPSLPGTLDKKYIQTTVREVVPLIKECYELALAEQAGLAGKLIVSFEIEGEPEIGGVVTTAEIQADDQSPLGRNQTISECVRETVMSLAFVAPEGGGKVTVRYPFVFRTSDDAKK